MIIMKTKLINFIFKLTGYFETIKKLEYKIKQLEEYNYNLQWEEMNKVSELNEKINQLEKQVRSWKNCAYNLGYKE